VVFSAAGQKSVGNRMDSVNNEMSVPGNLKIQTKLTGSGCTEINKGEHCRFCEMHLERRDH
jgi:hypothetical protein